MVRKQVIDLSELCVKLLSERIWTFTKSHSTSCELCSVYRADECPTVLKSIKQLASVPPIIIETLYNKIYMDFTSQPQKDEHGRKMFYLLLSLLSTNSVKVEEFRFTSPDDINFVLKFGERINSLRFWESGVTMRLENMGLSLWRQILQNANYIQILNLSGIKFDDDYYRIIGEECHQLQYLRGIIELPNDTNVFKKPLSVTPESLTKLFFRNDETGKVRNKCCRTLESVYIFIQCRDEEFYDDVDKLVSVLIQNLPNLKTVGMHFLFDHYLKSLQPDEIPKTNLEEIHIVELTNDLIPILQIFCPNVTTVMLEHSDRTAIENLRSFPYLKDLHVSIPHGINISCYDVFHTLQWAALERLKLCSMTTINVDLLAGHLPNLTELLVNCLLPQTDVIWNRKEYFKRLKKITLSQTNADASWFASFASTIKHIRITGEFSESFNHQSCQVLLTVPFPCLEYLALFPISYCFNFYTSVLATLPKLKTFATLHCDKTGELASFLKENNLECSFKL